MWLVIAERELKANVKNGRVALLALLGLAVFTASALVAARNHNHRHQDYLARLRGHLTELASYRTLQWFDAAGLYLDRRPAGLSTLVRGVEGSYGNIAKVSQLTYPQFTGGSSDSPLVTAFEPVDFLFMVKVLLSLCALLTAFDAVCGEKESGTLRLLWTGCVSRGDFFLGKLVGAFVSVAAPASLGFWTGLGALRLALSPGLGAELPLSQIVGLWGVSLLYVAAFVCAGLLVSSLTRRSITSLAVALGTWLLVVGVLPRTLAATASAVMPAPDMGAIEAEIELIRQNARRSALGKLAYLVETTGRQLSVETVYLVNRAEADEAAPRVHRLRAEFEARCRRHDAVARALTRLSPAGALAHAAMSLAETSPKDFDRYLDAVKQYRSSLLAHYAQFPDRSTPFNVQSLPPFNPPSVGVGTALREGMALDLMALATWLLALAGGAGMALNQYDPR